LWRVGFAGQGVGQDAGRVVVPLAADQVELASGVGAGVAERVLLGFAVDDDRGAVAAAADVDAAVGVPRRVVVREGPGELAAARRVVGVEAVVTVVVRREVVAPVAVDAGPVERVGRTLQVVLAGHVLDPGVVDAGDV